MANRPAAFTNRLVGLLADDSRRLRELRLGNLDVRAGFMASHRLLADAVTCHEEKLRLARAAGDRYNVAVALNNLGDVHLELDDLPAARRLFEEGCDLLTELGDLRALGMTLHNLGGVALRQDRPAESAELYRARGPSGRWRRATAFPGAQPARAGPSPAPARRTRRGRRPGALFAAVDPDTAGAVDELLTQRPDHAIQS